MKSQRLKKIAAALMCITAAVWIAVSALLSTVSVSGVYIGYMTALTLGGVPVAFLQLRLCLAEKERWVRWVPAVVAAGVYSLALLFYFGGSMYSLLGMILAVFGMAPLAGICLGWLACGKRHAFLLLDILFIIYLIANRIPFFNRPFEGTDLIAFLYLAAGIYLFIKPAAEIGGKENES